MLHSEHPLVLEPVSVAKSWGAEQWLNSTRPEAPATVANEKGAEALSDVLATEPALLGAWTRRLHGDALPIFTKLIRTDFPPLVHVGWRRGVTRAQALGWLDREQSALRDLLASLDFQERAAFDDFARSYSAWATAQALERWRISDEPLVAEQWRRFASRAAPLADILGRLRRNRAVLVDELNEIDLRQELDNLLLTPAGVVHSIFGLSLQSHPLDPTREALTTLFGRLRHASIDRGRASIDASVAADLDAIRLLDAPNGSAPKNEAWLPTMVGGRLTLVEPQQSSDTTYSLADFYTPFVWKQDRAVFRKGDPTSGLSSKELARQLATVELSATAIDSIRRAPIPMTSPRSERATLSRLVDEPELWPFFTAHTVELDGRAGEVASWRGQPPPGVFQQVVVLDGDVVIRDATGQRAQLSPATPAFIPATLRGGYQLSAGARASVLIFSLPSPQGVAHA